MKKLLSAVVVLTGALLAGCAGPATPPATTTPRMSVDESCKFLNTDTFVPQGSDKEKAAQISQHYQDVANKVAPEVAEPIQQMSDIMKQVAASSTGTQTPDQLTQLRQQLDKIGQHCK
ncbi:hypothetical protein AB4Y86_00800 [Arthrobacter sp. 2YAF22_2]|uniref:hypothetical protein n=1 Tax=Arthrobacter sp. 2YAF22_2 TaxID=3233029 RepID=UPI003F8ED0C1